MIGADAAVEAAMLDGLRFHWGKVYEITIKWGQPMATYREDRTVLTGDSLTQLEQRIEIDFASRITHESQPALDLAEAFLAEAEEDQQTLADLRALFPWWDIWYSADLRCYMAKPKSLTICEPSPDFLRTALTLIEKKRRSSVPP